ncbi:restriction endonuclease [Cupriavidus cauae]|uniref:type II restriction endonuclease n=1 Tax=Cupriavidus TaxID=106589 RepID=UPI001CF5A589|nr:MULTISPECIES: type II restriction endonuclease [Cupriavidus]MCA7084715.1 restriction endonuclease [Cupriavidus sp. DB3]UZN49626.1 restriction endonuclease [Cupriavidus cauae]
MKHGYLSEYFEAIAAKRLSAVEADPGRSNQHEFDGVTQLKKILGPAAPKKTFVAKFIYLTDDDAEPVVSDGFLTWYDARERHPKRSECRLYFPTTTASQCFAEGDLLVIAKRPDNTILVIVAEAGSTIASQVQWLCGLSELMHPGFSVKGELESDQVKLEFASRFILEQIGIEIEDTAEDYLDQMLRRFGGAFPRTVEFSAFARETLPTVSSLDSPDDALLAWFEREEVLFRTLERHLIAERLHSGFAGDKVDDFMSFSLSVQNRRKSRAGAALQNHAAVVFHNHGLRFATQARTENKSKPDFLFPGEAEYHDPAFDPCGLTVLGVKSTLKDRWRQVLAEAKRVPAKHLLTLEPRVSEHQTTEMRSHQLQLVVPRSIQGTFSPTQQAWLMSVADLILHVRDQQARLAPR